MIRAILLDIEGTTTPISFVHDVLFPYSRQNLGSYLERHPDLPEVVADLKRLQEEHAVDQTQDQEPPELVQPYVYWLIERDRKSPALKSLQGKIWEAGYKDGSLQAPVFGDVPPAMKRWNAEGKTVNIFSSGSVLAQKLLFAHTNAGDLTPLISSYFDTQVGKKTDEASYRDIAASLALEVNAILFISDVPAELDAATGAGMMTALCVRPGNPVLKEVSKHSIIETFDAVG
jgi:enolase-phosphatase E1